MNTWKKRLYHQPDNSWQAGYKTSDGEFFTERTAAIAHERGLTASTTISAKRRYATQKSRIYNMFGSNYPAVETMGRLEPQLVEVYHLGQGKVSIGSILVNGYGYLGLTHQHSEKPDDDVAPHTVLEFNARKTVDDLIEVLRELRAELPE